MHKLRSERNRKHCFLRLHYSLLHNFDMFDCLIVCFMFEYTGKNLGLVQYKLICPCGLTACVLVFILMSAGTIFTDHALLFLLFQRLSLFLKLYFLFFINIYVYIAKRDLFSCFSVFIVNL